MRAEDCHMLCAPRPYRTQLSLCGFVLPLLKSRPWHCSSSSYHRWEACACPALPKCPNRWTTGLGYFLAHIGRSQPASMLELMIMQAFCCRVAAHESSLAWCLPPSRGLWHVQSPAKHCKRGSGYDQVTPTEVDRWHLPTIRRSLPNPVGVPYWEGPLLHMA